MFNFFKKKPPEEISRTTPGFEETERKTPKAGILLLIVMFIAGIFFGWRALDDLGGVIAEPERLSSCAYRYERGYLQERIVAPYEPAPLFKEDYYYGYDYYEDSSRCTFTEPEKNAGIPAQLKERDAIKNQLKPIYDRLNQVSRLLSDARYKQGQSTQEYGIGLEEKQGGIQNPLFPLDPSSQSVIAARAEEERLTNERTQLENQKTQLEARLKVIDDRLVELYKPIFREQNKRLRWYEFWVFLLQFAFTLPFFLLALRGYKKLHAKSSPYTIIMVGVLAVASILFLRVILFWFWDLFLAQIIRELWTWIQNFRLLRSIVFYLGMILSFAVFGGAVYFLQKKIFDPRRLTIRRFRAKQCPHCQTSLDLATNYCPNCGYQLKEKCEKCGQARFIGLPNCPYCGNKK